MWADHNRREATLSAAIRLDNASSFEKNYRAGVDTLVYCLFQIVQHQSLECLLVLMEKDPSVTLNTVSIYRYPAMTMLHSAMRAGNLPVVKRLVSMGADLHVKVSELQTPLYSVFVDNYDHFLPWTLTDSLPKKGRGDEPVSNAVLQKRAECVRFLVEHGANWKELPCRPNWLSKHIKSLSKCRAAVIALKRVMLKKDKATKDLVPILSALVWETRNNNKWKK